MSASQALQLYLDAMQSISPRPALKRPPPEMESSLFAGQSSTRLKMARSFHPVRHDRHDEDTLGDVSYKLRSTGSRLTDAPQNLHKDAMAKFVLCQIASQPHLIKALDYLPMGAALTSRSNATSKSSKHTRSASERIQISLSVRVMVTSRCATYMWLSIRPRLLIGLQEAQTRVIDLPEEKHETIRIMLEWIYIADYDVVKASRPAVMPLHETIELHLAVAVAAEKYNIKGLRLLAVKRLKEATAKMT
jgi:hypothetical protein